MIPFAPVSSTGQAPSGPVSPLILSLSKDVSGMGRRVPFPSAHMVRQAHHERDRSHTHPRIKYGAGHERDRLSPLARARDCRATLFKRYALAHNSSLWPLLPGAATALTKRFGTPPRGKE